MTALDEAWLDLREVHAAIDTRRKALGLPWRGLGGDIASGTVARLARDQMPTEADGVFSLLDWLGLPAETFVRGVRPGAGLDLAAKVANLARTHPELPASAAAELKTTVAEAVKGPHPPAPPAPMEGETGGLEAGVTRIDALALHAALDARRRERGLTWAEVQREMGFPSPGMFTDHPRQASPTDLGRRGLGGRQEAHACVAMAHWLGLPVGGFLRRVGRHAPSDDLRAQLVRLVRCHSGLGADAAAAVEDIAVAACDRLLPVGLRRSARA